MADRKPIDFITVNHQHIPIFEGESKQDAYNKAIAKYNEDTKQRQIAKNKEQADKLNGKGKSIQKSGGGKNTSQNTPKTLPLKNISAKNANSSSDVLNLRTKQRFKFKDGTEVKNVYVFAGKGCSKEFRDAAKYANKPKYQKLGLTDPKDWQHCAGKAIITDGKRDYIREVHWVQGKDGKMREAFIKEYEGKNLKDDDSGKYKGVKRNEKR